MTTGNGRDVMWEFGEWRAGAITKSLVKGTQFYTRRGVVGEVLSSNLHLTTPGPVANGGHSTCSVQRG